MAIEFNVDSQVRPYAALSAFPVTGSVKTLYIDESTSDLYYWDGSAYAIVKSQSKYEAIDAINGTGATVLKMSVCYLKTSSSSANTPELLLSNASTEATSSKTIGLLLQDLANGATGKIITSGEYDKFDTSAYSVGDRLWLSTTDGQVTTTIPSAPTHAVFIGFVTRKQSQNGRILVSIQNGYELREIHDVSIPTTPSNNEVLSYESVSSLWKPKSITTLLGFTPVPTSRTLTINGTTQDLSADRTFTISTGITIGTTAITSGTVGRVLFEGTGNVVSESADLFWDNATSFFGVGTSTTAANTRMVINESFTAQSSIGLRIKGNGSSTNIWKGRLVAGGDTIAFLMGEYKSMAWLGGHNAALNAWAPFYINPDGQENLFLGSSTQNVVTPIMTLRNATGNILINTTTDAGFKLDVNGTARFSGNTSVVGTSLSSFAVNNGGVIMLQTASSGIAGSDFRFRLFTNNQAQTLDLYGSGDYDHQAKHAFRIGNTERMRIVNTGNVLINTTTDAGFKLDVNGTMRVQGIGTTSATTSFQVVNSAGAVPFKVLGNGNVEMPFSASLQFDFSCRSISSNGGYGALGLFISGGPGNNSAATAVNIQYVGSPASVTSNGLAIRGIGLQSSTYNTINVNGDFTASVGTNTIVGYLFNPTLNGTFSAVNTVAIKTVIGNVQLNTTSGNTLIGTTTDAGFKLDVNGTARVSGATAITGNVTISNASNLSVSNGVIGIDSNVAENNSYGSFNFGVNQTGGYAWIQSYNSRPIVLNSLANNVIIGSTTNVASAKLIVTSTTQGFLPPRLTTTQKNAIATPATGLQIYDSTLNRPCFYDGTTWITL